ncbi:MAG TPA: molybdopterin molybdenumtransferase MoeA [Desulfurobacteriaceae bacterium]|nr:molybdopterin molybdenumtransferase MoeA [Desulfurobacteriaceae bacterium]
MKKLSFSNAQKLIIEEGLKINLSKEQVFLNQALFRVLGQDIKSNFNIPDGNKSAIDGFAVNTSFLDFLPKTFKILKNIPPENIENINLKEDETVFVMTGAYIPKNANACIRIEDTKVDSNFQFATIDKRLKEGELINFEGQELKKGEIVFKKGKYLNFKSVALLAHLGYFKIEVFRKLKIGIFSSGNEIKEPYIPYKKGIVYNTNYFLIWSLLREVFKDNVDISYLGILPDKREVILKSLEDNLDKYDIIITCGGISKGKYDFIKEASKSIFEILIENTKIRPGSPFLFGKKNKTYYFGLPGYPSAALVNAVIYLIPFIKAIYRISPYFKTFQAISQDNLKGKKERTDFIRVYLNRSQGYLSVSKKNLSEHTSNFYSMAISDGLAIIPEDKDYVFKGEYLEIIDFEHLL